MDNYNTSYDRSESQSFSATFATLMRNVYAWMTGALLITALTSMVVIEHGEILYAIATNRLLFWGLILGELGLVWYLSARIMSMSFTKATLMFITYSVLNGLTMSLIVALYTAESVAQTFFITAGTFGAMSFVGFVIKKDLSVLSRILTMALIGLIIATVINIFWHNSGMAMIINYVGVLLFVGLTAYDTQKIKMMLISCQEYGVTDATNKVALMGSLSLYLDFINLFLFMLRIMGGRK